MSKTMRRQRGFSLVELLSVMCVIAVLFGVGLSAIPGYRSTYNRKTAVDTVMDTIEFARLTAIQTGENAYVILALSKDSGVTPDAMIVVGDPPLGVASTTEINYTRWIKLPLNVRFRSSSYTLVTNQKPTLTAGYSYALPPINSSTQPLLVGFTFNSTGTLASYPGSVGAPNAGLDVALFEGIRGKAGASGEIALGPSAKATQGLSDSLGLYEVIRLDRYSGRSWMEVTNLSPGSK